MGYIATTGFILYWNPYQPFSVHRSHCFLFGEYDYFLSIEYNHDPGSLVLKQDPEITHHN